MSKSIKAVLLSGLVFPGIGHFYLKKHIQGIIFSGIATISLCFLLVTTARMAQEISDKILNGEIAMDLVDISEAIMKLLDNSGIHQLNLATFILFLCWLVSMVDSFRLGRIEDTNSKA